MKTQRRHDLRENELAQSLEALGDSVRRNSTAITIVVVVVAAVIIGAMLFINHRAGIRRDAWQTIIEPAADKPDERVAKLREVAGQNVDSTITATALLKAADAAMTAMHEARTKSDRAGTQHWADEARTSYRQVIDEYGSNPTVAIPARFGLAILAEDRADYSEARKMYQAILADSAAKDTPFEMQAQYRQNHLDQWKSAVTFAPASAPSSAPVPASLPSTMQATPVTSDIQPASSARSPVASLPAATQPSGR